MKRTAWGLLTAAQQDDHVAFMAKIAAGATYVDEREGRSEAGPLKPEVLQPFLRNCALFDRGVDEGGGWRLTWQCGTGNYVGVYLYFRGGRVYRAKVENIPLVTTGVLPMQSARFPETVDGD
jgi:hypothetical protein